MEKINSRKAEEKISAYLSSHYKGAHYSKVTKYRTAKGTPFYRAEVSHENTLYHLQFDKYGTMVNKDAESLVELLDEDFGVVD